MWCLSKQLLGLRCQQLVHLCCSTVCHLLDLRQHSTGLSLLFSLCMKFLVQRTKWLSLKLCPVIRYSDNKGRMWQAYEQYQNVHLCILGE